MLDIGVRINIRWIPAHKGIKGNDRADVEAKAMTVLGRIPVRKPIVEKSALLKAVDTIAVAAAQKRYTKGNRGKFTWKLDGALPGTHTRQLYRNLNTDQARILVQARTGQNHLNSYKARIKAIESGKCDCGEGDEDI
ncbi:MAG: hypothetical protein EOO61_16750 [Hymenobacter sp.]|nr:MAG: hypothetical protein EOO61_16750 [Hymenobacter sp.]